MKILTKISLVLSFVTFITVTSCDDFLDKTPISTVDPNGFWKSSSDADAWMAGIYDSMLRTLQNNSIDWGEGRSDNVLIQFFTTGNSLTNLLYTNSLSASSTLLTNTVSWDNLYNTITSCNYGLKYFPEMIKNKILITNNSAISGKTYFNDYMGQCYGIRALMYFYGVRVWGRMPILPSEPITKLSTDIYFSRQSLDSCKTKILNDIDSCILYILKSNRTYSFSIGAAWALRADVNMWFRDYNSAANDITSFENLGYYGWITNKSDWKTIFTTPENSKESIFSLFYDYTKNNVANGLGGKLGSSSNTSAYPFSPELMNDLYSRVGDGRKAMCFDTITYSTAALYSSNNAGATKCGKYYAWNPALARIDGSGKTGGFAFESSSYCTAKTPIYRYADIELMKAEIFARKGDNVSMQKALDVVNIVRSRVGYNVTAVLTDFPSPNTQSGVIDCIMKERRIEFFGEGKRWFDLIRASTDTISYDYFHKIMDPVMHNRLGSVDFIGANQGRILSPIVTAAFQTNYKLRGNQNPPYSE